MQLFLNMKIILRNKKETLKTENMKEEENYIMNQEK